MKATRLRRFVTATSRKPPAGRLILIRGGHHDHRAAGTFDHPLRDAADEQVIKRTVAVRADDDEISLLLPGFVEDLVHDGALNVQGDDLTVPDHQTPPNACGQAPWGNMPHDPALENPPRY